MSWTHPATADAPRGGRLMAAAAPPLSATNIAAIIATGTVVVQRHRVRGRASRR
ncbi:hypothetical protein AB0M47_35185 [Hamadaea sp. NPDC051192]|uniref:hypothetical protein n=1 Tax=Hamadaea sp. NPDC051192 TaxID=3154940 RepID=UPI00342B3C0F